MAAEEKVTYCRICEPLCGMVATVEDDRLVKVRPDGNHPLSAGFACPKGIAMVDVQNDPDRVVHPLRRKGDGSFERVTWPEALDEIGQRLGRIVSEHGGDAVGWYMGNPGAFSYSHPLWVKGFLDALGSPHSYTASSQDVSNRFAASWFLYGSPFVVPIPDLPRTDFLLMVGANPLVSHGSVLSAPRIKDQLHAITARGGRIIVVDPRRSETARAFEHVAVNPDSDAWLLLSMLQVIFAEGLEDADAIGRQSSGAETLRRLSAEHPPEATEGRTGVAAAEVRQLARDLASAERAAVYGRTGSCLGRNGTLVAFLLDALNVVTGNLDREGGAMFGDPPIDFARLVDAIGLGTYSKVRSRVGDLPEVLGSLPASVMAKEMTTPGKGQIRAMFFSAGNPVLSVPNGEELEAALGEAELSVALDLYVTETSRNCDFILPATTFYEREDFPLPFLSLYTTPFIQMSEPVTEPRGEAKQEWEVIEEISKRIGVVPSSNWGLRLAGRVGVRFSPRRLVDLVLRTGPKGDLFGLRRGGLSVKKLASRPHGIVLAEHLAPDVLRKHIRTEGKRVRLDAPEIAAEVERLVSANGHDPNFPLRLIGLRELRSHNSWMHNAPLLMRGGRTHAARIHPEDAEALGLADGGRCRIASAHGAIETAVAVTDEVKRGTVAVPHGWGHRGGWQVANAAGGANVNVLASSDPDDLERLAGMAFLNGIPVRVEPLGSTERARDEAAAPVAAGV
ncbi:MAG TPA: molybdopterin-dependent oxidoreductase [Solirubrobacterales bacterium]|nr:molybdopterin-dependent oxidoreductase [Solirubrobacterales bacterium]